ncbi:MAG: hypothetical protein Q4G69_14985, partial [Planctomycetia bacterium]|nr:hypothetical protein [Planctomycetia bacterium]
MVKTILSKISAPNLILIPSVFIRVIRGSKQKYFYSMSILVIMRSGIRIYIEDKGMIMEYRKIFLYCAAWFIIAMTGICPAGAAV